MINSVGIDAHGVVGYEQPTLPSHGVAGAIPKTDEVTISLIGGLPSLNLVHVYNERYLVSQR